MLFQWLRCVRWYATFGTSSIGLQLLDDFTYVVSSFWCFRSADVKHWHTAAGGCLNLRSSWPGSTIDRCALAKMSSLLCKSSIWSWRVRFWAAASLIFSSISTLYLSNSAFTWIDRACSTATCSSHCFLTPAIACCASSTVWAYDASNSLVILFLSSSSFRLCSLFAFLLGVHVSCCHRSLGLLLT